MVLRKNGQTHRGREVERLEFVIPNIPNMILGVQPSLTATVPTVPTVLTVPTVPPCDDESVAAHGVGRLVTGDVGLK